MKNRRKNFSPGGLLLRHSLNDPSYPRFSELAFAAANAPQNSCLLVSIRG
jgi:hypothetical protein